MLKYISPKEVHKRLQEKTIQLIDIREAHEYASARIQGVRLIPQPVLDTHPLREAHEPKDIQLVFFCHSGGRTEESERLIAKLEPEALQMEGGLEGWIQAGLPVERSKTPLPLFRQIQIGAGALVLLGILGSAIWHPMYWLSAFVGAGLIFSGITGFCGLGILLGKMPWNQRNNA